MPNSRVCNGRCYDAEKLLMFGRCGWQTQVSVGGGTGGGTGGVIRSQSSVEVAVRWAPDMLGPPKQEGHLVIKMVGGACRGMHVACRGLHDTRHRCVR